MVIGQPCFHVRLLRFGRNVWMAALMNSRHVWRQSINFDLASRCSLSHTSLVGLATTASIASPSRSWLLSGQQQVVSGEVGEASRPVSLVSTFSALWPAPKAGHLGWGEPGHHRLHQVRPFFSSLVGGAVTPVTPEWGRVQISPVTPVMVVPEYAMPALDHIVHWKEYCIAQYWNVMMGLFGK